MTSCHRLSPGAAHGLSAVLQMLLSVPEFLRDDPVIEMEVRQSVDFLLGLMQPNGNVVASCDELNDRRRRAAEDELVHWCHGGPGTSVSTGSFCYICAPLLELLGLLLVALFHFAILFFRRDLSLC